MKEKNMTIYVANDGSIFKDKDSCIYYETKIKRETEEDIENLLKSLSYGKCDINFTNIMTAPLDNITLCKAQDLQELNDTISSSNIIYFKNFERKTSTPFFTEVNNSFQILIDNAISKKEKSYVFYLVNGIWIESEQLILAGKKYCDSIRRMRSIIEMG